MHTCTLAPALHAAEAKPGAPAPATPPRRDCPQCDVRNGTACRYCGAPTVPTGHCRTCTQCGETTGCG